MILTRQMNRTETYQLQAELLHVLQTVRRRCLISKLESTFQMIFIMSAEAQEPMPPHGVGC